MDQPHLLVFSCPHLERHLNTFLEKFQNHFYIVWFSEFIKNSKELGEKIVAIFLPPMWGTIDKNLLDLLPNLLVVSVCGAGVDHLDLTLIRSYGVKICSLPGILANPAADMAMALLFASARNIVSAQLVMNSETSHSAFPQSVNVTESTMGILGMGTVGFAVAKRAMGFNMTILYHNRRRRPLKEEQEVGATFCPQLLDMLAQIDFLVVCVDLNSSTTKMIGEQEFRAMRPSATIVNISRGCTSSKYVVTLPSTNDKFYSGLVIDQDAMVAALSEGWIRAAALDVTYPEPLPRDHPLLHLNNVIITPHLGKGNTSTFKRIVDAALENILAGVEDRPFPYSIND